MSQPINMSVQSLPMHSTPFVGSVPIVPGTDQLPQRAIAIVASVAGNVVLKLDDTTTLTVPVAVGLSILPFAVVTVVAAGTTATAAYTNLK